MGLLCRALQAGGGVGMRREGKKDNVIKASRITDTGFRNWIGLMLAIWMGAA